LEYNFLPTIVQLYKTAGKQLPGRNAINRTFHPALIFRQGTTLPASGTGLS
jgi:hypothetical protein